MNVKAGGKFTDHLSQAHPLIDEGLKPRERNGSSQGTEPVSGSHGTRHPGFLVLHLIVSSLSLHRCILHTDLLQDWAKLSLLPPIPPAALSPALHPLCSHDWTFVLRAQSVKTEILSFPTVNSQNFSFFYRTLKSSQTQCSDLSKNKFHLMNEIRPPWKINISPEAYEVSDFKIEYD